MTGDRLEYAKVSPRRILNSSELNKLTLDVLQMQRKA